MMEGSFGGGAMVSIVLARLPKNNKHLYGHILCFSWSQAPLPIDPKMLQKSSRFEGERRNRGRRIVLLKLLSLDLLYQGRRLSGITLHLIQFNGPVGYNLRSQLLDCWRECAVGIFQNPKRPLYVRL